MEPYAAPDQRSSHRRSSTCTCWGYTFQVTPDHLSAEEAQGLKASWDVLADEALSRLNRLDTRTPEQSISKEEREIEAHSPIENKAPKVTPGTVHKRDLYQLLRSCAENDIVLASFWSKVNVVPEWVDWAQIARGQDCFYRYGGPMLTALAFQSLIGGLGASRIVETLTRTGGFSTSVARNRLFETTQFILQCTRSLASIQPGGEGFASCIRVRLLHAAVRTRILKLASARKGYYHVEKFGVPINDLDSIATLTSFSATLIWLGLPRQGIFLKEREIRDFIALFRYIGFLTGTPTSYFETPEKARKTMESLLLSEINPTSTSRVLAHNVIESLANQAPGYASRDFLEATARWLNGDELCDALLGPSRPSLYHKALVAGQCLFFMVICYTHREVPMLDKRKIATLRRVFWAMIVGKHGLKAETVFEFKHVPNFNKLTKLKKAPAMARLEEKSIERRNLSMLMMAGVLLSSVIFLMWRLI